MHKQNINQEITEAEIDEYGRKFIARKEYGAAIAIFKFKIVIYGKTEMNYDCLAKAYEGAGDKIKALQVYQDALLIFDKNKDFIRKINRLKSELN